MKIIKTIKMFAALFIIQLAAVNASNATEVSKEYWMDAMKTALPATFCKSEQFFRQCFNVTVDECEKSVTLATRLCLHKYINQIPDTLLQPKDGAKWANIIGQCVGEGYQTSLSTKFKDTHRCNDINHWK